MFPLCPLDSESRESVGTNPKKEERKAHISRNIFAFVVKHLKIWSRLARMSKWRLQQPGQQWPTWCSTWWTADLSTTYMSSKRTFGKFVSWSLFLSTYLKMLEGICCWQWVVYKKMVKFYQTEEISTYVASDCSSNINSPFVVSPVSLTKIEIYYWQAKDSWRWRHLRDDDGPSLSLV